MRERFRNIDDYTPRKIASLIGDCVRAERKRQGLTQVEFAHKCNVPLRTYKRFEQGQSDSLQVFINIAQVMNRITAFDLFFVQAAHVKGARSAVEKMEELQHKMQNLSKNM